MSCREVNSMRKTLCVLGAGNMGLAITDGIINSAVLSPSDITLVRRNTDKLSAYIKCVEEQKGGNTEFDSAAQLTMKAMKAMAMPELDWFIEECLPAFSLNLDQLN